MENTLAAVLNSKCGFSISFLIDSGKIKKKTVIWLPGSEQIIRLRNSTEFDAYALWMAHNHHVIIVMGN